jgi:biopolymer transport protein ExbD
MAKREVPEINGGAMADIAFMLLIFFLVVTTMAVDSGLERILPRPPDQNEEEKKDVLESNIFVVKLNFKNELLVKFRGQYYPMGEIIIDKNHESFEASQDSLEMLITRAKDFLRLENNKEDGYPEKEPLKTKVDNYRKKFEADPEKGRAAYENYSTAYKILDKSLKGAAKDKYMRTSKGVISLYSDRDTKYGVYIAVSNALVRANTEVQREFVKTVFGPDATLNALEKDQSDMIKLMYPGTISETEPITRN